jgi:Serine hydrolase (FSH1)
LQIAGFLPRDVRYTKAIQEARPGSAWYLFVHGSADLLVPAERSRDLAAAFAPDRVRFFEHDGKHCVPTCSGNFKSVMVEFLDQVVGPLPQIDAEEMAGS